MRWTIVTSLLVLTCWAHAGESGKSAWDCAGNQELATAIEKLVGPNVVDCGFHDLSEKIPARVRRQAHDCVSTAMHERRAFKFATISVPLDSIVTEVLVRAPDGKLWMIVVDQMFDEQPTQWNAVCERASVDQRTLYLDRNESCVEYSGGPLVLR